MSEGTEELAPEVEAFTASFSDKLNDFSAGLSDEERNVLSGILGAAAHAGDEMADDDVQSYGWGSFITPPCVAYTTCYYSCVGHGGGGSKWRTCGDKCRRKYPGCY